MKHMNLTICQIGKTTKKKKIPLSDFRTVFGLHILRATTLLDKELLNIIQ